MPRRSGVFLASVSASRVMSARRRSSDCWQITPAGSWETALSTPIIGAMRAWIVATPATSLRSALYASGSASASTCQD
jgi:hypothetical protein